MMKRMANFAVMALVMAWGSATLAQEAVSGQSGPFAIDTRRDDFKIGDVRGGACWGAYGTAGGKKATFLNGVEAWETFEVTVASGDKDVEITGVNVMGEEYAGTSFRFNVGSLAVGTPLEVVARGVCRGENVESEVFRVNVDVARQPMIFGLENLAFHYVAGEGYVEAGRATFQLGKTKSTAHTAAHPWWLPAGGTGFAPLVALKSEFSRSQGTLRFTPGLFETTGARKIQPRRRNGQFGRAIGIDFGFGVGGVMVFRWDPALLAWVGDGIGLEGEVEGAAEYTWPFPLPTPIGPIPMFAEVGLEAALRAGLTYHGAGETGAEAREASWEWSASSEHLPTISGALGVGANHKLDVKGGIKANGIFQGSIGGPDGRTLAYGISGTLFGTIEVLGWSGTISGDSDTYWFFGGENARGGRGRGIRVDWAPMGRGYLRSLEPGIRRQDVRGAEFETGGFPSPQPAAAWGGGANWVAYLRDDGTRGDADRTEVVVQTGTDGEWGSVEKPWDDGTADWMPSLAVTGNGTAVLAWANAKQAWGTATPEFGEVAKGLELAVAVRDAGTGTWSAWNLTDDNAADFSPVVCAAGDGTAMVAWLRNEGGALFGSAESPTAVMASRWNGSTWSAPTEMGRGTVSGLDLAYDGTNACVVWAFDGDGDLETAGDSGVSAAVWNSGAWGATVTLAEGLEVASPVVAQAEGLVSWGESGKLMERAADGSGEIVAAKVCWNGEIPGTAIPIHGADGALGLAWAKGEEENLWESKVVVMEHDAAMGAWGGPMAVGEREAGHMAKGVSAARGSDGAWRAAWESVAVATNAEGTAEFGDTVLRWAKAAAGTANPGIAADGFAFTSDEVADGELTGLVVTVRNTGTVGVSGTLLRVWACDGELEEDEEARQELWDDSGEALVLDLPGGAVTTATVSWMAEDFRTNLTFVARLELPEGAVDADLSNNEAVWHPGVASLQLEGARCEAVGASLRLLTATVKNRGLAAAAAGTAVSFRLDSPDGAEVGHDVAGVVRAGEGHGYDAGVAWDMAGSNWTGAWVTVYAVIDTGNAESDASGALPIRVMTPLDTDGEGLLDGEEEAMGTDLRNPDTNGDGISDYDHVYVWFTDPLAGMGGSSTTNTPVRVPFVWLEQYEEDLAAHGGDYEAFAADTAANGRPVWACYVADLDPTKADSELRLGLFQNENGDWIPRIVSGESAERRYVFEGTEKMPEKAGDPDWGEPDEKSRFFRARVTTEE